MTLPEEGAPGIPRSAPRLREWLALTQPSFTNQEIVFPPCCHWSLWYLCLVYLHSVSHGREGPGTPGELTEHLAQSRPSLPGPDGRGGAGEDQSVSGMNTLSY